MSNLLKRTWYSDGMKLVGKVDRWVSRRYAQTEVGQESDWLGWDGWVRTDSGAQVKGDTANAGRGHT